MCLLLLVRIVLLKCMIIIWRLRLLLLLADYSYCPWYAY